MFGALWTTEINVLFNICILLYCGGRGSNSVHFKKYNYYIERQRVTAVRKNQFGLKWELMELNYLFDHKCNPVCVDMKLKPYP